MGYMKWEKLNGHGRFFDYGRIGSFFVCHLFLRKKDTMPFLYVYFFGGRAVGRWPMMIASCNVKVVPFSASAGCRKAAASP